MYYLPVNFLRRKLDKKKKVGIIYELSFLLLIYLIGENLIINDFGFIGFYINLLLKWILFTIIILKPVNIKFKIFFDKYAPQNNSKDIGSNNDADINIRLPAKIARKNIPTNLMTFFTCKSP